MPKSGAEIEEEMKKPRLCPLLMIAMSEWPEKCLCSRDQCAWWHTGVGSCAILILATLPMIMAEQVEKENLAWMPFVPSQRL